MMKQVAFLNGRSKKDRQMKLYVMRSPRLPFRSKIGITGRTTRERADDIARSMRSKVHVVFSVSLWFAPQWERFLHALYHPLRAKIRQRWSGHTEWFWFVRWISVGMLCLFYLFECLVAVSLLSVPFLIFLIAKI